MDNYFIKLNCINCNEHTEKKGKLTYLSWTWAWTKVKELFPDATYKVYENELVGGMPYFTDGKTCMVKVGVTINGIENIEWLPVMDFSNKSIPVENVTSFDINKANQRALTKACARHGLGLYIYAGEDLPEEEKANEKKVDNESFVFCRKCKKVITDPQQVGKSKEETLKKFEEAYILCPDCLEKAMKSAPKKKTDET